MNLSGSLYDESFSQTISLLKNHSFSDGMINQTITSLGEEGYTDSTIFRMKPEDIDKLEFLLPGVRQFLKQHAEQKSLGESIVWALKSTVSFLFCGGLLEAIKECSKSVKFFTGRTLSSISSLWKAPWDLEEMAWKVKRGDYGNEPGRTIKTIQDEVNRKYFSKPRAWSLAQTSQKVLKGKCEMEQLKKELSEDEIELTLKEVSRLKWGRIRQVSVWIITVFVVLGVFIYYFLQYYS